MEEDKGKRNIFLASRAREEAVRVEVLEGGPLHDTRTLTYSHSPRYRF